MKRSFGHSWPTRVLRTGLGVLLVALLLRTSALSSLAVQPAASPLDPPAETDPGPTSVPDAAPAIIDLDTQPVTDSDLEPWMRFPLIINGYFTPYTFDDDFSTPSSLWPVGKFSEYKSDRSAYFEYGYKTTPDGYDVYHIRVKDLNDYVFMTGPAMVMGDFTYEAKMRRSIIKTPLRWEDEYGLLLSPTEINPKDPYGRHVYTFQIQLWVADDEDDPHAIVKWWDIDDMYNRTSTKLHDVADGTHLTDEYEEWNQLRISRSDGILRFAMRAHDGGGWSSWTETYHISDPALSRELWIGFYARHAPKESYNIEFDFDNVHTSSAPGYP